MESKQETSGRVTGLAKPGASPLTSQPRPTKIQLKQRTPPHVSHERRVLLMALGAGLPGALVALVLLWSGDYSAKACWTLMAFIVFLWLGFAVALQSQVVRPLQTMSNLLAALREGDYSIRGRGARDDDALGEVMREINALGETLRAQRLGAFEATALLRTVMSEINVAVFAFDGEERLRLVNRAGERLLAMPEERLLGRTAMELNLSDCLHMEGGEAAPLTLQKTFPGSDRQQQKWGVRRSEFRERGRPHQLLVVSDLSQPLREEERRAWQRIVRVIGHELNNSLAPIKSIAGSLATLLMRDPAPIDWREDMQRGLLVVSSRAESLSRFMEAYARLARLPPPRRAPVNINTLIQRVVQLETRARVGFAPDSSEPTIEADADQLEQLLINLVSNAVDATLATGGDVRVAWKRDGNYLDVVIEDEGLGIANNANLFVPFFTTKPGGSGIGLVLSRQIAEAHGGTLTLENRPGGAGCEAHLRLPL